MSEQSPITRRDALLAATAIGAIASVATAQGQKYGEGEEESIGGKGGGVQHRPEPIQLEVTLPDGQVVNLKAVKAVVVFASGRLQVTSNGILPAPGLQRPDDGFSDHPIPSKSKPTPTKDTFDEPLTPRKTAPANPFKAEPDSSKGFGTVLEPGKGEFKKD